MTLSLYIFRRFMTVFLAVFVLLSLLYALLDMIEVVRRYGSADLGLTQVLTLTLLRTTDGAYQFLPFMILLATIAMFLSLSRSSELVVVRGAGRSALRLLLAPIVGALLIGVLAVTTFNPMVAISKAEYERLSHRFLGADQSVLSVSRDGLWLRQGSDQEQTVIRARGAVLDGTVLQQVSFFGYDQSGAPAYRMEAEAAQLRPGAWHVSNYRYWQLGATDAPSPRPETGQARRVASTLTPDQIRDGFGTPNSISLWSLPGFIAQLEQAGFSARRHIVWFQSELARPLLFVASTLIGAMLTMRHNRGGKNGVLVVVTLVLGSAFFFVRNFALLLGENGQLPVALAVWAVPVAAILLALALILHLEDG